MAKSRSTNVALVTIEPTDAERRQLTNLAQRAQHEYTIAVQATATLRAALDAYRSTVEVDLPEAMRATGQAEFKLLDGTTVKLKHELEAGQLSDYGENPNLDGLAWVEGHGGAPLVRAAVTAEFDAEDITAAREIYEMIRRHPAANRMKALKIERRVLWNTLTKWCRELVEQMRDPPLELLGVRKRAWVQVGEHRPKTVEIKGFVER